MAFDFTAAAETLKAFAVLLAIVMAAYAGFRLATGSGIEQREEWKEVIAGVLIGLALLFLAPLLASQFSGATYCGG